MDASPPNRLPIPGLCALPPCKIRFTKQLLYVMIILSRISGEEYRQYTMKYEEYPTKHPAPESQTLGRKPLPSNVILGETAYSPGDHAVTLWPFYDPVFPVNVMAIGETKCRPDYHVIRPRSRIMAIEYIAQGAGIFENQRPNIPPGTELHDSFNEAQRAFLRDRRTKPMAKALDCF